MIYRIKITLKDIRPPVWRRIEVSSDVTLAMLHETIQSAMGWQDCHLHEFNVAGKRYGPPMDGAFYDDMGLDETKVKLSDLVHREKDKFTYTYDFGDNWGHTLTVEKIVQPKTGVQYPICTAGKRACPLEDCGGPWGYAELIEAQKHPDDPRYEELLDWAGDLDPEAFDLETINTGLQWLR